MDADAVIYVGFTGFAQTAGHAGHSFFIKLNLYESLFVFYERGLHSDYESWLEGMAPHEPVNRYHHNLTGKNNADEHLKCHVMEREVWWR